MAERMWQPSPSPVDSYSDASDGNEDDKWPVKAVVGEEIRLDGTSRYEVRWDNWHRRDGSNTTWVTEKFDGFSLIRRWQRIQERNRNSIADCSLDMEVPWPDDAVHKRLTDHRSQAYDEKLRRRQVAPVSTADWDAEIDKAYGRLQEPERGKANSKLRVRRANPAPASGSSAGVTALSTPLRWSKRSSPALTVSSRDQSTSSGPPPKRGRVGRPRIDSTPTSSPRSAMATPSAFSRKGMMVLTPSSAGSSRELEIAQSTLPSVIISPPTLRGRISSAWNKAAKEARAATVRICPEISDENVPRNLRKFEYMEKGYAFCDNGLQDIFNPSRGVFTMCDCMTCSDASDCPCRDLSKIYDVRGKNNFTTYSEGIFTFEIPRGIEVIECNKHCGCDYDCGNRVAQHPRNIGIEIFDTERCGWGVRALDDIPKGKVLGTYTGRRDDVDKLPEEHQGYLFDLDGTEVRDSENLGGRYSVDSYECGNWTRFVNHSCGPNMEVYCVVYDTIPYVNMPYVAFVASTDIQTGTELTIDYNPYAEQDKKGKRTAKGGEFATSNWDSCVNIPRPDIFSCCSALEHAPHTSTMFLAKSFSELLGFVSIGCWLGAQFPQILENIKQQSCESLALPFLFNWMLGDASNLIGCLLTHQLPFQTYLATYFCCVDCCLLYQFFYYGGNPKTPPITYPRTRSRTTSSAQRLSIDASQYRTMSTTAGNIAAVTALAAYPDTHPEHRYPRKPDGELLNEQSIIQHPSEVPQNEVSDAVLTTLSESFHSESGRKKSVSWSQERHEHPTGGSSRRHMSPVVPRTLHHKSASAAALLARGRSPRREEETEVLPEEQVVETEQRNASRASRRRSAGMVLLGMGVVFSIGRYTGGAQPMVGRGLKTGAVLVPTSSPDLSLAIGLPVAENPPNHLTDPLPSSVDVELPSLPSDAGFSQQRRPDKDTSYDRVVGRIFAWLCTTLYLTSRLPQIWKNYIRKSVEGLSMYLFIFAFLGNFFYVLSILTSPPARLPPPASTEFFRESLPYLLGSGGTFIFDITIVSQSIIYKGRPPRRSYIRSRGNSLVRSAALAEETAGLLRGDTLATTLAHSEWAHAESIAVSRSRSRGRQPNDGSTEPASNQTLAEPRPDHLRNLVFNYLCHNCYLKTAEAFEKDSVVRHLDKDGDEIPDQTIARVGDALDTINSPHGSSTDLSDEMVRNILLRQRIQFEILSGNVAEATALLNRHFPRVLAEDDSDNEMEVTDENVNPSRLEYIGETVNPTHLSLNLRILAFVEACRTIPLVYTPPSREAGSPISLDSDVAMVEASPVKRDLKDEENHQEELLVFAQKLSVTVNALGKSDDRAIYSKELSIVGGLLAYTVPENSPMAKYLHQERRDRVAEQINSAILYHTNMPSVSYLELAVRYTHCLWAILHELRVKVPATHRLGGISLPLGTGSQSTGESEKEPFHEARPFDLQLFLNKRT
ncbi:hypothetical protein J3R82DRAFT_6046 [Butyriboletus roseoflavus]|nr:hypothetical protein J3R82DRAFT_6046 [Butyriboletus roseoflavus]